MDWSDIEEIAYELLKGYGSEDIYGISFTKLREMVLSIDGFVGGPADCSEGILEKIQATWFELTDGDG